MGKMTFFIVALPINFRFGKDMLPFEEGKFMLH